MRVQFVVYVASGAVVRWGDCDPEWVTLQANVGESVLDTSPALCPGTLFYVSAGVITARPACPVHATVAARTVSLTGVPIGAAYTISGDADFAGVAADSTPQFTFGAAGVYTISVSCFPAIDFKQEFTIQ